MMLDASSLSKQENAQKHFCFYELNMSFILIKHVETPIDLRQLFMGAIKCLNGNSPQVGD